MAARIKTNIKFYKGLDNVADRLYGFVTKKNFSWRGCREDEPKKKIVFVEPSIAGSILPNQLYHCSLVPMACDKGFIAKSATLIQFEATIITACRKGKFFVKVSFGNKELIYDPSHPSPRKNNIQKIADNLRNRMDLKNAREVAEDFINNACMIKRLYEQYKQTV